MINLIASPYCVEDILKLNEVKVTSIIVGMPFYSVRSVSHFNNDELLEVAKICKNHHIQMYVLMNRFFIEEELNQLKEQLIYLKQLDVDGIYFSDMGVYYEAMKLDLHHKLIYNPDTILTNAQDIKAYMDLGLKMCCVAKEITLEDMVKIGNKLNMNLEVMIHGRLNMMHSKRNLLGNYMEFMNVDKNLKDNYDLYLMEENREEHMPIVEDEHGTHIYTGFTLCSFEEMEDLIDANICNFRIESMFYSIDEICDIVRDYREVVENPLRGRELFKSYEKMFPNQNITKGFLYKKTGLLK